MRFKYMLRSSQWIITLSALTVAILAGWAAFSDIEQIARGSGQVIASARTQVIQSAIDGVIDQMLVKEGDAVEKGQILVRLDRSQAEAAYLDSMGKVAALKAALTRLQSEVFSRPLSFPPDVIAYPAFVANQTELFQRRQNAVKAEISSLEDSLSLVGEELALSEPLLLTGDIGKAEIIRLQRQVTEIKAQITNRRNKYFQDAQAEMTKVEEDLATQEHALAERTSILERTDISAPANGIVKNIQMTTLGAKLRPGDVIMELLPTGSALVVEIKLKPVDMAFMRLGLPASIKLDSFDYSIYGVIHGKVSYISPDTLSEKTPSGEQIYYRARIDIDEPASAGHNEEHPRKPILVQPGMTATVEIRTGKQSVLSYLTKPLVKTFSESLGER